MSEELAKHYGSDFGMETRIARFHNIYVRRPGCARGARYSRTGNPNARPPNKYQGPYGTWKGGREKAPASFCRKVLASSTEIEMWGDGKQTRSFTYIDDCVEGILRITRSDFREPLNLGSTEMVSMNGAQRRAV